MNIFGVIILIFLVEVSCRGIFKLGVEIDSNGKKKRYIGFLQFKD